MEAIRWICVAALAIAVGGCAGGETAPRPEVRQVLAPAGKLRAAMVAGTPYSMIQDPASGETKGVAFELARELARRLGVPFEPVSFRRPAEGTEAIKAGQVDVVFTNATPARAKDVDFSAPYLEIESGYLVPAGSPIAGLADIDRPGLRIGVIEGGTTAAQLAREFKSATVMGVPSMAAGIELMSARKADAFATNKAVLSEMSDKLPGSRILEGRFGVEYIAVGIPKGREAGLAFVNRFVEEAKSSGLVRSAVQRAGVRGTR